MRDPTALDKQFASASPPNSDGSFTVAGFVGTLAVFAGLIVALESPLLAVAGPVTIAVLVAGRHRIGQTWRLLSRRVKQEGIESPNPRAGRSDGGRVTGPGTDGENSIRPEPDSCCGS